MQFVGRQERRAQPRHQSEFVDFDRAVEKERRLCAVKLTEAERVARGDEMADCEVKIEALKAEQSELARQVKTHAKRRNELGHSLDTGTEQRELLCTWEPDYPHSVFKLTRPDSGEVIDTRPMSAQNLNVDLFPATGDTVLPPPPRLPKAKRGRPSSSSSGDRPTAA